MPVLAEVLDERSDILGIRHDLRLRADRQSEVRKKLIALAQRADRDPVHLADAVNGEPQAGQPDDRPLEI